MKPAADGTMPPIAAVRLPLACRGSRRRLLGGRAARCRVIWDGGARTSVAREGAGPAGLIGSGQAGSREPVGSLS